MAAWLKENITLATAMINDIVGNEIPQLTYANLLDDPIMVKAEWGRAQVDLADLETILAEINSAKKDWRAIIVKMNEANRDIADTEMNNWLQANGPDMRRLFHKIRDLKKEAQQWKACIEEYDRAHNRPLSEASDEHNRSNANIGLINAFDAQKSAMEGK